MLASGERWRWAIFAGRCVKYIYKKYSMGSESLGEEIHIIQYSNSQP